LIGKSKNAKKEPSCFEKQVPVLFGSGSPAIRFIPMKTCKTSKHTKV
jgi:hypothetical protein